MFEELVSDPRPLSLPEMNTLLARLRAEGRLTARTVQDVLWTDLLVQGTRDGEKGYLVVEASWTIGLKDIDRAVRRAALLRQGGEAQAWPVVIGYRVSEEAEDELETRGVLHLRLHE
jgi:hypothetical protein